MAYIRVYQYGLLPPTKNADLVLQTIRGAHSYQNSLIEVERGRRAALREALGEIGDIPTLQERLEEKKKEELAAEKVVKSKRAKARSRAENEEDRQRLRLARAARAEAARNLREAQKKAIQDEQIATAVASINEKAVSLKKGARALSDIYWGTYLVVERAMDQTRKTPIYKKGEPNDPRFRRWSGEGQVGVLIQHGIDAAKIFGNDRRARIDPVDELAWNSPVRGERRRLSRTNLHLRIDSDGRDPVWATWPMIMHRPFPANSLIKSATVQRRMIGPREQWAVQFTLEIFEERKSRGGQGAVAINLGWRKMAAGEGDNVFVAGGFEDRPEGLEATSEKGEQRAALAEKKRRVLATGDQIRVLTWVGEDGRHGELRLDAWAQSKIRKADELRGTRDDNFNQAKARLSAWIKTQVDLPEWFQERVQTLDQWKSQQRLSFLALLWREKRFPGDEEGYTHLEAWRYHDHHLWSWEASQRTKGLRHRRDIYRRFAAWLSTEYHTLVVDDFDLSKVAHKGPIEEDAGNENARSNRQLSGVSILMTQLQSAFVQTGQVSADLETLQCSICLHVNDFDKIKEIEHTCASCGILWDQDRNAAGTALRRWLEAEEAGKKKLQSGEYSDKKWSKVAKLRAEKQKAATA